jgi:multidrug efflux pump subunit AcrB
VRLPAFSTILLFVAAALIGFALIPYLQLNFLPKSNNKSVRISYQYPNADPEQVERVITTPLEAGINLIQGVDRIESVSGHQNGYITAHLDKEANVDQLRFEIATKIRELYPRFPEEVPFPRISLNDPDKKIIDPVIVSYSLLAPRAQEELYDYIRDRLIPELSHIPGLERIELSGKNESEWRISYNHDVLMHHGIYPHEIANLIRQELNSDTYDAHRLADEYLYVRSLPAELTDLTRRTVTLSNGTTVALSSLIEISLTEARPTRYYRINGNNSIRINFIPKGDANHLNLARDVHEAMLTINRNLPSQYSTHLDFDSTDYIRDELSKIKDRTLWSLGLLLLFVLIAYRSFKDLVIIISALFVNVGLALICYYALGIQINLYALAAITISFGMIIDNSIVISHHFQKHGNLKVYPALLTSTLTTLASLIIVLLLPEQMRLSLIDFATVLALNLAISLIVCITVVPALVKQLKKQRADHLTARQFHTGDLLYRINRGYRNFILKLTKFKKLGIMVTLLLFGLPVFYIPNQIKDVTWYNESFGSDYYIENIKPWVNRALGGTLRLFSVYVYEGSAYRSPEETKLYVNAALPMGSTIEQMNDIIVRLENYLSNYSAELSSYISIINSGQNASIAIIFKKNTATSFPYILKSRIESFAIDLGGVTWNIYGVGKAFSNASGSSPPRFTVLFKGYNKEKMGLYADEFAALLLKHPRIQKVETNANLDWWEKDKYQFKIRRNDLYAQEKLTNAALYSVLNEYNQYQSQIAVDRENKSIRLVRDDLSEQDKWRLMNTTNYRDTSQYLLGGLIDLEKEKIALSIHKEDQSYIQKIEFEYTGSARFGQRYLDQTLKEYSPKLPLGYQLEQKDYSFFSEKARIQYSLVLLVIVLIYVLSTIHFESFKMGGLVVLLIPLSFIGIFLTFYWFDFPFDQGGYTSFLLVSGLAVNAIILILFDYQRLKQSYPWIESVKAYARAFRYKSTPIYLSILSTALGLIPFTLHGSDEVFWFSLAVGTIGGLLFSLVVLTMIIPIFLKSKG